MLPDPELNGLNPLTGLLDPTQILACNRIVPLDPAPEYSEGFVSITAPAGIPTIAYPAQNGGGTYPVSTVAGLPNVLMLEEAVYDLGITAAAILNPPTSWFWNIRVGDKIQINNAGAWYTVVGPMVIPPAGLVINGTEYANPEMFVNVGPPGTQSPVSRGFGGNTYYPDFLFLVNGQDDNGNGWADEGWDGIDNDYPTLVLPGGSTVPNPGAGIIDNTTIAANGVQTSEWESEQWLGSIATNPPMNAPYTVRRRPAPSANAREVALPTGVVIDLTGWGLASPERSRIPARCSTRPPATWTS